MIVDFILQILAALHEATPPSNVVSAFEQAGICSRSTGPDPYMARREAFVDRARARQVIKELGLFRDEQKNEQAHQQLKISNMNDALQRAQMGGEPAASSSTAPAPCRPSSAVAARSALTAPLPPTPPRAHLLPLFN